MRRAVHAPPARQIRTKPSTVTTCPKFAILNSWVQIICQPSPSVSVGQGPEVLTVGLVVALFAAVCVFRAAKAWKNRLKEGGGEGTTDATADGRRNFTGMHNVPPVTTGAPPAKSEPLTPPPPSIDSSTAAQLRGLAAELGGGRGQFQFYCSRTYRRSDDQAWRSCVLTSATRSSREDR